jgi:glycerophosphoryl diester phosphodiesterase
MAFWTNTMLVSDTMLVIGHRGACGYEPENTILSFKKALQLGVDIIEFDVRKSLDGKLVIIHDATVNRTTNGTGAVADMTFEQLRKLDAGKGQQIPTLQEVLDFVERKVRVNVEIKAVDAVSELANIVHDYITKKGWRPTDFLISSFHFSALQEFHQLMPTIQLMLLFSKIPNNRLELVHSIPVQMVAISAVSISKKIVDQMHSNNISVIVFTINDPKEIEHMKDLGVDGICSNYPDRVKRVVSVPV